MHIFESKEDLERGGTAQYHIEVSYVEIYNEEIRDLLNPEGNKKLEIKGNSGAIQGERRAIYHVRDTKRQNELGSRFGKLFFGSFPSLPPQYGTRQQGCCTNLLHSCVS